MAISNQIFIYNGKGADPICVEYTAQKLKKFEPKYSVISVDGSYFGRNDQPFLYVLPGGGALTMGVGLAQAAQKINHCIQKGSGMLGFCAGAMVSCSDWNFFIPSSNKSSKTGFDSLPQYRLNLGPIAFGPTFHDSKLKEEDHFVGEDIARLADIYIPSKDTSCKCFWNRGPIFQANSEHQALARYTSPTNPLIDETTPAAVIHTHYGQGRVSLLGIHPELAEWSKEKGFLISDEDVVLNNTILEKCYSFLDLNTVEK